MFPVINIGPLALQAAGLILIICLWLGIYLSGKFASAIGTNGELIENSILVGIGTGILGARIGFFLQNPSSLLENPLSLFSLSPSMLNVSFGLLVGLLTAFIMAQKKHLPLWPTLDTLTPLLILIYAGIHLANFANGNAFGLPTELPWAVALWGARRHPVQLYAFGLTLILFLLLFFHTKQLRSSHFYRSGQLFNVTLAGLSFITLFTRAFVAEKLLLSSMDGLQILSFLLLLFCLFLIYSRGFKPRKHIHVYISMGSNINPKENIAAGLANIEAVFKVRRTSSTYQTEDVSVSEKAHNFLNKVIEIETALPYPDLYQQLKEIERKTGREGGNKKEVVLDLDILTYEEDVFSFQSKQIPDPNLIKYLYIVEPLAEIAPGFRHPASGKTIQEIQKSISQSSEVLKVEEVRNGVKG